MRSITANQHVETSLIAKQCAEKMIASYYNQASWFTRWLNLGPNLAEFEKTYLYTTEVFNNLATRSPWAAFTLPEASDIFESCDADSLHRSYKRCIEDTDLNTISCELFKCKIFLPPNEFWTHHCVTSISYGTPSRNHILA